MDDGPPGEPPWANGDPPPGEPPWLDEAPHRGPVDAILAGLDAEQRRAVTHGEGPLLIVAGAGTGKTTVIARRIAHLIATKRAHPAEILALTFTERAAAEMEQRVDLLVPYGYTDTTIATFHAFGDRIVREHALRLGLTDRPRLLAQAERVVFLRERLFRLPLRRLMPLASPTRHLRALLAVISRAKDEAVLPADYLAYARRALADLDRATDAARPGEGAGAADDPGAHDPSARRAALELELEIAEVYRVYQEELERAGCMDFGDQILVALRILRECPDVAEQLGRSFRYILVDEFQDTNVAQYELLRLLARQHRNLTVVGDDDQSIYRFRGAAISNILGFTRDHPERELLVLRRNYRSGQRILDAAHRLIRYNDPDRLEVREGIDKRLESQVAAPGVVEYAHHPTLRAEADALATRIGELVEDGGRRYRDIAVLVRSNQDAQPFVQALEAAGIPHQVSGNQGLYGRPEVQFAVAFLRAVTRRDDDQSLYLLATSDLYGVPVDDLVRLNDAARGGHLTLRAALERAAAGEELEGLEPLSAGGLEALARLRDHLALYTELARQLGTGELLYRYLSEAGVLERLVSDEGPLAEHRVRNVSRFFELIGRWAATAMADRAHAFVDHQELLLEAGDDPRAVEPDPDLDVVRVMTVHRAKGLEFACVLVANLVTRKFPTDARRAPLELPDALHRQPPVRRDTHVAEERRLFYVAMTRARELLVLSSAADHGGTAPRKPSRFVLEAVDLAPSEVRTVSQTLREELARFGRGAATPSPGGAGATDPPVNASAAGARRVAGAVPRLPVTRIEDFDRCPLRFRLGHVLGVPAAPHHSAIYGTAVHAAIAAYLGSRMRGASLDAAAVRAVFASHWRSTGFLSREHEERRYAEGLATLDRFVEREGASRVVPASVEKAFRVTVSGARLEGRIDRIDLGEMGEGATLVDYKTAPVDTVEDATQRARRSLQLKLYALAYREMTGAAPRCVALDFVESGVRGVSEVGDRDLETAAAAVARAVEALRDGRFEARPSSFNCPRCPFVQICPEAVRG
ncbi:MAG: ATP-dependent DNA helicase [Candidatus Eiseniibacteriota bacterium]